MATHSSVLAWRIPGTGEPGGLPFWVAQSQTQLKRLSSSKLYTFERSVWYFFFFLVLDFQRFLSYWG